MRKAVVVSLLVGSVCVLLAPGGERPSGDRLAPPVRVEADGKPIASDDGVLFPFVGDIDGDGRPDLLLGTREKGRLLVYRNVGTKTEPRLSGPQWFDDTVPTGRIPFG
jgi:FG-GAP repeat